MFGHRPTHQNTPKPHNQLVKINQNTILEFVFLGVLQLSTKKRYVYGAIAFIWLAIPTIKLTFTIVTTDILQGRCMQFAVYKSHAMEKSIGFFSIFITYLLPLALMVFCYARIVHALRTKVISPCSEPHFC